MKEILGIDTLEPLPAPMWCLLQYGHKSVKRELCSNCGFCLEQSFCFCPKCGNEIKNDANDEKLRSEKPTSSTSSCRSRFSLPSFSLPSFGAFKAMKETERQSSFSRKSMSKNKKRKIQEKEVTIQVGVMDDNFKVKRGETIPLKVASSATAHVILAAAIKKQSDFNKHFDNGIIYVLVFKDGTDIEVIPGTDPPEQFTLLRYKEVSGFGYSDMKPNSTQL